MHVLDEGDAAHNQDVKMQPIAGPDNKPREHRLPNFRSSPTSILPPGAEAMITPGSTVDFDDLLDEIERLTRGSACDTPRYRPANREP